MILCEVSVMIPVFRRGLKAKATSHINDSAGAMALLCGLWRMNWFLLKEKESGRVPVSESGD